MDGFPEELLVGLAGERVEILIETETKAGCQKAAERRKGPASAHSSLGPWAEGS